MAATNATSLGSNSQPTEGGFQGWFRKWHKAGEDAQGVVNHLNQFLSWCNNNEKSAKAASLTIATGLLGYAASRNGWGRALMLFRSRGETPKTPSVRISDVDKIKTFVQKFNYDRGYYLVVKGDKGMGKTTAIKTALEGIPGVLHIDVRPGSHEQDIFDKVMLEVSGCGKGHTESVIYWFRWLSGSRSPVVVLHANEVPMGERPAQLTGVTRNLVAMKVCVIIDASPNSLPAELLSSVRERVLEMSPLTDSIIEAEFGEVLNSLGDLNEVAKRLIGGIPGRAVQFLDMDNSSVENFVLAQIQGAVDIRDSRSMSCKKTEELVKAFKGKHFLPFSFLKELDLVLPNPDKMIRTTRCVHDGEPQKVLVPAFPAMGLVLFHGWGSYPTIEVVKAACRAAEPTEMYSVE